MTMRRLLDARSRACTLEDGRLMAEEMLGRSAGLAQHMQASLSRVIDALEDAKKIDQGELPEPREYEPTAAGGLQQGAAIPTLLLDEPLPAGWEAVMTPGNGPAADMGQQGPGDAAAAPDPAPGAGAKGKSAQASNKKDKLGGHHAAAGLETAAVTGGKKKRGREEEGGKDEGGQDGTKGGNKKKHKEGEVKEEKADLKSAKKEKSKEEKEGGQADVDLKSSKKSKAGKGKA